MTKARKTAAPAGLKCLGCNTTFATKKLLEDHKPCGHQAQTHDSPRNLIKKVHRPASEKWVCQYCGLGEDEYEGLPPVVEGEHEPNGPECKTMQSVMRSMRGHLAQISGRK